MSSSAGLVKLRRSKGASCAWLACAMLVLGNVLLFVLVRFNYGSRGSAPSEIFLLLVVGFVLFTAWWVLQLYKRLST